MATYNFLQRVCIVTGASSGIGRAAAVEFAKSKARLVLVGRNVKALEETLSQCKAAGCKADDVRPIIGILRRIALIYCHSPLQALIVKADICKNEDREEIVKRASQHFGKIHILVCTPYEILVCSLCNLCLVLHAGKQRWHTATHNSRVHDDERLR